MNETLMREADEKTKQFITYVRKNSPHQEEFIQAVGEVVHSVMGHVLKNPQYLHAKILERMVEPDRVITFRVTWQDDKGELHVNRGWRVQFNNSIGPYKGGTRFHPSVTLSVLKFLGFEQCFKNSLTGLPMGGGKGGANFNPKGRSDDEVMRFCQSLMNELYRHIGEDTDVPAGDIGVGAREIGYMFGQYKRIVNRFTGVMTGKGLAFGGSLERKEATGYGVVYFCQNALNEMGDSLDGKTVGVSGSGNVAIYVAEKAISLGGKVVTLSDSSGFIHDPDGFNEEKLAVVKEIKEVRRERISEYAKKYPKAEFHAKERPWIIPVDLAIPAATQNEVEASDAKTLINNKVKMVVEAANMPSTLEAIHMFTDAKIVFCPGKAANAGGVAVSGLEQSQNSLRLSWSSEEIDERLQKIMKDIHRICVQYGKDEKTGRISYLNGANIGGFVKVADAMLAYGVV